MKRKHVVGSTLFVGLSLTVALILLKIVPTRAEGQPAKQAPRAVVISDLGDCQTEVEKMTAMGWAVRTVRTLELEMLAKKHPYEGVLAEYDVVWVPAKENYPALRLLMRDGGPLDKFARGGGVVAVMDLTPQKTLMDIAPGGTDAQPIPAGGAGAVRIEAIDHPMVTGFLIGGSPLVPQSLDPQATGGRGCIVNPPQGCHCVVVAANSLGPVLMDYTHGKGRVLVCALHHATDTCERNAMLYLQSIAK